MMILRPQPVAARLKGVHRVSYSERATRSQQRPGEKMEQSRISLRHDTCGTGDARTQGETYV